MKRSRRIKNNTHCKTEIVKQEENVKLNNATTNEFPNFQEVFLKEYELCFGRAESIYDLMNNVIQLYTTVFFAVISVFGFASTDTYGGIFGNSKLLPISLLFGLVIFGIATLFMHIATWAARNEYRKRRSRMRNILFGAYRGQSLKEELIEYLIIPRYVDSHVLRSLSLCMWYYLYIFLCNWIALILLSSVCFGIGTRNFFVTIGAFPFIQWLASEVYVKLKQHSHHKHSEKQRKEYKKYGVFYLYSKMMDKKTF